MKNTRTTNSVKNSIVSMLTYVVTILMGFVCQAIFLEVLNIEYNGIKGLFSNILNMLNIAELGFGSAIIYHLYKPIAEKNINQIKILVKFYRTVYHIIACVILIIGIFLLPIIPMIVGEVSVPENIRVLFFLYLLSTVVSYLLTYKRSILYADQKNYITKLFNCVFVIIRNLVQILVILITKSFTIYLIAQIILPIIENIVINIYVNSRYEYVRDLKSAENISTETKKDIITKVKGLLFHKIGSFVVTGTDNIIISMSKGLGVVTVGMYSNYYMVISQVSSLFGTIITSLTASVGNLLVEKDTEKSRSTYQSMLLLNSWIFCFCAISILCMIEPFIKIWIGNEYLLSQFVLIVLVVNMYIQGMRNTNSTFKEAAGIFYEDRYVPIIESVINVVVSLICVRIFGLAGVFIGTIASTMLLFLYSYPKFVYKKVLDGTYKEYFILHLKYLGVSLFIALITKYISNLIVFDNAFIELLGNGILCLLVPNILYLCIVRNFKEFGFYKEKIEKILKKSKKI